MFLGEKFEEKNWIQLLGLGFTLFLASLFIPPAVIIPLIGGIYDIKKGYKRTGTTELISGILALTLILITLKIKIN